MSSKSVTAHLKKSTNQVLSGRIVTATIIIRGYGKLNIHDHFTTVPYKMVSCHQPLLNSQW